MIARPQADIDDLLIVGGGPIGATLALALRDSGLSCRLFDARESSAQGAGDRTLALAHNARLTLERVGVWERVADATAIHTIDISQKGGFGITQLTAREAGVPALGYVIRYSALQAALDSALADAGIAVDFGCKVEDIRTTPAQAVLSVRRSGTDTPEHYAARLVAVADGSGEALRDIHRRKIDYRQCALTGLLRCEAMQPGVAFERFTSDGPVALLPFEPGYALVWTATPSRAAVLLAMDDNEFLAALYRHFGARVGHFTSIGPRQSFPLSLQFASQVTGQRSVVLGNAAQALHPIAGQGFNLGLRDVWSLAQLLLDSRADEIGTARQLDSYASTRGVDRWTGVSVTHGLVRAFSSDHPLLRATRGLGLTIIDSIPPLKRALARTMLNGLR